MNVLTYLRCQWDRVGAVVAIGVGGVALVIGWFGVSGSVLPAEQIPYVLSGGLGGIFLLGLGSLLWLSADLRDEWRKLDALERGDLDEDLSGDARGDGRARLEITSADRPSSPTSMAR